MTDESDANGIESQTSETRRLTVGRVIEAPPARVYEAFVNPDELAQWMHPPGASAEVHHMEPDEGGTYRITMRGEGEAGTEYSHSYGGTYHELVPGERIVQTEVPESADQGENEAVTIEVSFDAVPDGTEVTVVMEVPADWPDDGIAGWEAALNNLAGLLEGA